MFYIILEFSFIIIYDPKQNKQKNKTPFLISDLRFKNKSTLEVPGPGPGTYENLNNVKNY